MFHLGQVHSALGIPTVCWEVAQKLVGSVGSPKTVVGTQHSVADTPSLAACLGEAALRTWACGKEVSYAYSDLVGGPSKVVGATNVSEAVYQHTWLFAIPALRSKSNGGVQRRLCHAFNLSFVVAV